jgi:hypothetical protein
MPTSIAVSSADATTPNAATVTSARNGERRDGHQRAYRRDPAGERGGTEKSRDGEHRRPGQQLAEPFGERRADIRDWPPQQTDDVTPADDLLNVDMNRRCAEEHPLRAGEIPHQCPRIADQTNAGLARRLPQAGEDAEHHDEEHRATV